MTSIQKSQLTNLSIKKKEGVDQWPVNDNQSSFSNDHWPAHLSLSGVGSRMQKFRQGKRSGSTLSCSQMTYPISKGDANQPPNETHVALLLRLGRPSSPAEKDPQTTNITQMTTK